MNDITFKRKILDYLFSHVSHQFFQPDGGCIFHTLGRNDGGTLHVDNASVDFYDILKSNDRTGNNHFDAQEFAQF